MLAKGSAQVGSKAEAGVPRREIGLGAVIWKVERAMLPHPAKAQVISTALYAGDRYRTKMRPWNHRVAILEPQNHVINPTNPRGALDNGIEYGLHVRRRPADDAEHLGGRRLMLQCFAQFCISLLDFLKQAH